jgi:hypothetical protein
MRPVKLGFKTISKLRSALATALMFWCAGAGCMMVSYARGAAMSAVTSQAKSSNGWAQASAGAHDCCKARHAFELLTASPTKPVSANFEEMIEVSHSSDAMSCCPLTSGTFVVTGRQTISDENLLAPQDAGARTIPIDVAAGFHARALRLPNQNHTYLRDCVFLI